jgi:hypothetical protein
MCVRRKPAEFSSEQSEPFLSSARQPCHTKRCRPCLATPPRFGDRVIRSPLGVARQRSRADNQEYHGITIDSVRSRWTELQPKGEEHVRLERSRILS